MGEDRYDVSDGKKTLFNGILCNGLISVGISF